MSAWRSVIVVSTFVIGCAAAHPAAAQGFDSRWWSPVPPAQADEAPPPGSNATSPSRGTPPATEGSAPSGQPASPGKARAKTRSFVGKASYYAYRGGKTASGAPFRANALTAAHRTLPFGTRLHVTDLKTHNSVDVVVTDRGPHRRGRVLDISLGAAKALHVGERGVIAVRAEVIGS